MLKINELAKSYGPNHVLRGVCLNVLPGTVHGLVGANGAGKTTLINCLYGLETGFSGTVQATATPGRAVRETTGLLPCEPHFYPRLTGREYLQFCLQARRRPAVDFEPWNQLLELPLDRYADEYSTGMRKKLALLALFVQDFAFLILDEPFNGLDLEAGLLLTQIIKRLRDRGTGILLTSHLLGPLTAAADEISVLINGRIERHYTAATFGTLESDLLDHLYREKLTLLNNLL